VEHRRQIQATVRRDAPQNGLGGGHNTFAACREKWHMLVSFKKEAMPPLLV
jgi:hypothetical protein